MITHKILQIVKKTTDGAVTGVYVQLEISDGSYTLGYDTTLTADKQTDLKAAIEDWAAIKTKEFNGILKLRTDAANEKARHAEVKIAKESVSIDSTAINDKADKLPDAVAANAAVNP